MQISFAARRLFAAYQGGHNEEISRTIRFLQKRSLPLSIAVSTLQDWAEHGIDDEGLRAMQRSCDLADAALRKHQQQVQKKRNAAYRQWKQTSNKVAMLGRIVKPQSRDDFYGLVIDGKPELDAGTILEHLRSHWTKRWHRSAPSDWRHTWDTQFPLDKQPAVQLEAITYEMVTEAIWNLPPGKAAGWDQMSAMHLRSLPPLLVRGLAHVFTCLERQETWPDAWSIQHT
eukprot:6483864-Amphidinium_carterae.1